jgi:hypothetical protein
MTTWTAPERATSRLSLRIADDLLGALVTATGCAVLGWWSASGVGAMVAEAWPAHGEVLRGAAGTAVLTVFVAWAALSVGRRQVGHGLAGQPSPSILTGADHPDDELPVPSFEDPTEHDVASVGEEYCSDPEDGQG